MDKLTKEVYDSWITVIEGRYANVSLDSMVDDPDIVKIMDCRNMLQSGISPRTILTIISEELGISTISFTNAITQVCRIKYVRLLVLMILAACISSGLAIFFMSTNIPLRTVFGMLATVIFITVFCLCIEGRTTSIPDKWSESS